MAVLVTGCAGFIGARVCTALLAEGHRVIGIDNLADAYDVRLKEWRLFELRRTGQFVFAHQDIRDEEDLEKLFGTHRFDAVVNLAALAGVRQSILIPRAYYETNVKGTQNLLELCCKYRVGKLVLASTSSLYSGPRRAFKEDDPLDLPRSPYASSKKAAETSCYTYHCLFGLDVTVFRYFSVYGPAGRPDMSIFRLIRWIAEGDEVVIYGEGTQERDFTFVDDVARGTVLGLKPLGYEVINLGNDRPVPLRRVVALLESMLGRKAKLRYEPAHPADAHATWANISKAQALLGWSPRTSLEQGLQVAIDWYVRNRSWASKISTSDAAAAASLHG